MPSEFDGAAGQQWRRVLDRFARQRRKALAQISPRSMALMSIFSGDSTFAPAIGRGQI